ncbi:hypothetical protein PL373_09290 [Tenacibaculum maritimum]|nr:hypothetical protein [Tenacibaculum maritimum]MDB0601338.1 hypothetical protein [Tenacibaculum maritimum]MDB0611759.1 hypothetical protein [Tenacibaculum maritimum]
MKKALFVTDHFDDDFKIKIEDLDNCNQGVYRIEVIVPKDSVPLIIKDGSNQVIREDYNAFLIESSIPIINGTLEFEFKENADLSIINAKKSATVRYLYCDE